MTRAGLALACILVAGAACKEGGEAQGPGAELGGAAVDRSSPAGPARCLLAATDAEDLDALIGCFHPIMRDDVRAELAEEARAPGFWAEMADKLAPLEAALAGGDPAFTVAPMPAGRARYGDQMATLRYSDRGTIEVVRQDGAWYLADAD